MGKYKHNWGYTCHYKIGVTQIIPYWNREERSNLWLNHTSAVNHATDKVQCLQNAQRVWYKRTTIHDHREMVAEERWCQRGHIIYCRQLTRASEGRGIIIATQVRDIRPAPLYTSRLAIKGEYRVHVFNGKVIDYQKKRKREEAIENGDIIDNIRNLDSGWVYCRNNLNRIQDNEQLAIKSTKSLGLTFGAVDIIRDINHHSYVLEVNTAPGLEGLTLINYTNAIKEYLNDMGEQRYQWNTRQ